MPRTFVTPDYTTTVVLNGTTKRKLSSVSPGTTDSTATKGPSATLTAGQSYYLSPEATAIGGTLQAVGSASGVGWALVPSDAGGLLPLSTDGFTLSAGSFTVQVVAARDTGLTSADQTAAFTAVLYRANATAASFPQELGRATLSAQTITTTKTAFQIVVNTLAATFAPGEVLWLEIFAATTTTSVTGSVASYYTNSATGIRISATTATYQTNYFKAISDGVGVSDLLARKFTGSRQLSDSLPVADALSRTAAHPRALSDALTPVVDTLARQFNANRALSDAMPVSDNLSRRYTGFRALTDAMAVTDAIARRVTYARSIVDALSTGGSATVLRRSTFIFGS